MSETLHYAFEYRDMGLSVLPLRGKKPEFPWRHLTERRPTYAEIKEWFGQGDTNIGIICGRLSQVVALDADSKETAEYLLEALPHTEMMTATSKGRHFYYRIDEGQAVPPRVRVNGMLLDVRGEASYCVACPSIHPEDGRPYRRLGSWNLDDVPLFDADWIEVVDGTRHSTTKRANRSAGGQRISRGFARSPATVVTTPRSARHAPCGMPA